VASGRNLRIGTEVRVIVTSVNPIEGLIDLDLVPEPGDAASAKEAKGTRERRSRK
jgi:hypothetical protein